MNYSKASKLLKDYTYERNDDYIYNFNFIVNIGKDMFGFSKISHLDFGCDVQKYKSGGKGRVHKLFVQNKNSMETLTLEKGVTSLDENAFERKYQVGNYVNDFSIIVTNGRKIPEMAFYFEEGIISKRSFSNLDAENGNVLMLNMEIKHTGLKELLF